MLGIFKNLVIRYISRYAGCDMIYTLIQFSTIQYNLTKYDTVSLQT